MIGRPKLTDGSTRAIQLKIGAAEFDGIEDWRFANRIESRSEAIRRLIQIGLRADARALEIAETTRETFEAGTALWERMLAELKADTLSQNDVAKIALALFDGTLAHSLRANKASVALLDDVNAFHQTSDAVDELEKAIAARDEYKKLVRERSDREHEE